MNLEKINIHDFNRAARYTIATKGSRYDWKKTAANIREAISRAIEHGWFGAEDANHFFDFEIKSAKRYVTKSDGTLIGMETTKCLDEWYIDRRRFY
jgi:NADH:ubiquinone oxidoreductase subunit F (NADH-binding)